jgi:hypothetical protein
MSNEVEFLRIMLSVPQFTADPMTVGATPLEQHGYFINYHYLFESDLYT